MKGLKTVRTKKVFRTDAILPMRVNGASYVPCEAWKSGRKNGLGNEPIRRAAKSSGRSAKFYQVKRRSVEGGDGFWLGGPFEHTKPSRTRKSNLSNRRKHRDALLFRVLSLFV